MSRGNDKNESDRIGLRVTAFSAMGSRRYNEDFFSVAYQENDNGKDLDYAYIGVFDGHGGYSASLFAKNHLMNFIVNEKGFWSDDEEEVKKSIKKGFLECHNAMWKDLDKWPPTNSGLPSTAGTTASIAFIRKGKLYIGHCGDSGIVLGRASHNRGGKWMAQALTTEHKPESPDELARIESFGGKVQQKQGIHRVVWYRPKNPHQGPIRRNTRIEEVPFLAVARSLGDLWSYNYKTEKFVVSPEPDVHIIDIDINDFKCLIFASDGLWNVIDSEFSVESVFETERQNDQNARLGNNTWQNPSRILVECALNNWKKNNLRADNTSVVCVMLDPPNKKNMFKFPRNAKSDLASLNEMNDGSHTIFDYSTHEAYNLDFMDSDVYQNSSIPRPPAFEPPGNTHVSFYDYNSHQHCATGYNRYPTSFGYQVASTSSQPQSPAQEQVAPALTYQASSNENVLVKACCRNNYLLASPNEQIPYHSSYEQHREYYENMALKPYPPLHYAYRPVPMSHLPLPSLHTNIYDHQGYVPSPQNYKPMERYNYLRPTPEELAAIHNEEDEDEDTSSDSNAAEFSDDESDDGDNECTQNTKPETDEKNVDDSIQIFEISSSSLSENERKADNCDDYKKKPTKSNNKENSNGSFGKKKPTAAPVAGRFYATRQTDRKMRSSNTTPRAIGRGKLNRRITKNIRKVAKTLVDQKSYATRTNGVSAAKAMVKAEEIKTTERPATNKPTFKSKTKTVQLKEGDSTFKKQLSDKVAIVRSLRSNSSNVVQKPITTRKRPPAFTENIERSREKRFK